MNGVEVTKEIQMCKRGDACCRSCVTKTVVVLYIATKSLSNSNGDANCDVQSGSICINGSVASREPCSSIALL